MKNFIRINLTCKNNFLGLCRPRLRSSIDFRCDRQRSSLQLWPAILKCLEIFSVTAIFFFSLSFLFAYLVQHIYKLISPLFLCHNWPSYHCDTRRRIVADLGKTLKGKRKWKKRFFKLWSVDIWVNCYCWGNSSMVEGQFSKWF